MVWERTRDYGQRTKHSSPFRHQHVWCRVMPRHGQELAVGVRPLDVAVPVSTQIPFLLRVAARRSHCRRPPACAVVLVDSPLVKTGPIRPDSGNRHACQQGTRYQSNQKRAGQVFGGGCFSRCFEPILVLHDPPHLIEGLALILVQAQYRRPVFKPFFRHLPCLNPGLHAGVAWSPVLGSCSPAWGRPARAT